MKNPPNSWRVAGAALGIQPTSSPPEALADTRRADRKRWADGWRC